MIINKIYHQNFGTIIRSDLTEDESVANNSFIHSCNRALQKNRFSDDLQVSYESPVYCQDSGDYALFVNIGNTVEANYHGFNIPSGLHPKEYGRYISPIITKARELLEPKAHQRSGDEGPFPDST